MSLFMNLVRAGWADPPPDEPPLEWGRFRRAAFGGVAALIIYTVMVVDPILNFFLGEPDMKSSADIPASIRCIVRNCADIDMPNWWCIERAEHDGRTWDIQMKTERYAGSAYCTSARLGEPNEIAELHNNADIEGDSFDMLEIAKAIETGGKYSARRCSAETVENGVYLESPRNSRFPVLITHKCAQELAADIRAKVHPPEPK